MNDNPVENLRTWALQSITFAVSVANAAKTPISKEVVEQNAISAYRIMSQMFDESVVASGGDPQRVDLIMPELTNRVFDWVAGNRKAQAA